MKRRAPYTIHSAVQRALGILLDDGVQAATGRSARLVRAWSDPDDDERHIPLYQALNLDVACVQAGEPPPILAVYRERVRHAVAPAHSPADPWERLAEVMEEVGDLSGELRAATCPHGPGGRELTAQERAEIQSRAAEAILALQRMIHDMDGGLA